MENSERNRNDVFLFDAHESETVDETIDNPLHRSKNNSLFWSYTNWFSWEKGIADMAELNIA